MNPIRLMGKAFYNEWLESVKCMPKFEELPECYLLQLDDCIRAAVRALVDQEDLRPLISSFLGALADEDKFSPVPHEENTGAIDAA